VNEFALLFACGFLAGLPALLWLLAGERIAIIRNVRADAAEAEAKRLYRRILEMDAEYCAVAARLAERESDNATYSRK
jgi:O-phosphoseryl-tRNA(Cys) synthetase